MNVHQTATVSWAFTSGATLPDSQSSLRAPAANTDSVAHASRQQLLSRGVRFGERSTLIRSRELRGNGCAALAATHLLSCAFGEEGKGRGRLSLATWRASEVALRVRQRQFVEVECGCFTNR
ncbi:MAG: hypothetical protein B9S32_03750 [Verrucomicrobia bacterium Tous-C9LFEB]|nr:MAG: hypothetical protein B9S32_03750 [Verrucomicrobia bacterium Tous-C9LFEB]